MYIIYMEPLILYLEPLIIYLELELLIVLFFFAKKNTQKRALSNKSKGRLGSRYIYIILWGIVNTKVLDVKGISLEEIMEPSLWTSTLSIILVVPRHNQSHLHKHQMSLPLH